MKIIIIGGVAAGTKVAAKLRRENPFAEVKILTKSKDISYAGCGLPYYVGGVIENEAELIVNTPEKYEGLTLANVVTECEVTGVDFAAKTVKAVKGGEELSETYDKLIIASGAEPILPPLKGIDLEGVFPMRQPSDAIALRKYVKDNNCKSAVVAGAGFIGLEIAENLRKQGLNVTVVDMADQVLTGLLDSEVADYATKVLRNSGTRIQLSSKIEEITGETKADGIIANGQKLAGDVVVMAIGVRPATSFVSGLEMINGSIVVDEKMATSVADVYAVGDCAIVKNRITGTAQRSQMGSTANITGRLLAKNLAGQDAAYHGCLGTGVVKLTEGFNAGRTGLTEKAAKDAGFDVVTAVSVVENKPHYMPGSSSLIVKLVADKASGKLLGIQVLGDECVDKVVDAAVVGLSVGLKVEDYLDMDFAYAPPFSTAIHPLVNACFVLENKMSGKLDTVTPVEYAAGACADYTVVDVQAVPTVAGAKAVNFEKINGPVEGLDKDAKILLVCGKGKRAYLAQNRLRSFGYTNTKVLEGGLTFTPVKVKITGTLPASEIKRVKGLGCLQDKRYPDVFNVRVITRNGKITADEHRAVLEASALFGSGEVAMTTRLTLEIQGVPFDKIDDCIAYLKERGLDTGGTGSLVRPVVACKGTTCQYGLLDSYGLSEKLHNEFYIKWHTVTLPHKFKIAVGGCPNNCVKPDLNDLGIIGQRVPVFDASKCHGCKVCQVENTCPIKIAKVADGKLVINPDECNHCGRCIGKCPFKAIEDGTYGYKIAIGGRWGKRVKYGVPLRKVFTTEAEVMEIVEKAILLFRDEGITGERFSDTIDRLGFDYVEDKLLNGKIDKEEILKKTVIGGAKC
ncbi:MAG: FAD-dependent oxidoreductase [Erysipelotrichaceae bacterium]|nr:FAD-dependent oxidoreductase [Erysipelotrichaceae bacterium]